MIDWRGHGLPSSSLGALCLAHGFYCEAHRARAYVKPSQVRSEVDVPMFASFAPRPVIRRVGAEA